MPSCSQTRLKRVDFMSGVLMFNDLGEEGTKTGGSGSDGSPRSSEGSPEGAASTLLAPAHRDHDQEEGSRTLVLVSTGNGQVFSPGDGQGTLAALTPQGERPMPDESIPGTICSIIKSEPRPIIMTTAAMITSGSSSPPFTKVEQTFIHIAETTHLNVMTAKHHPSGLDEVASTERELSGGGKEKEKRKVVSEGEEKESNSEQITVEKEDESRKECEVEEEREVNYKKNEESDRESDREAEESEKEKSSKSGKEEADSLFVALSHSQLNTTAIGPEDAHSTETKIEVKPDSIKLEVYQQRELEQEECPPLTPEQNRDSEVNYEKVVSPNEADSPNRKVESVDNTQPHLQRRSRIPMLVSEEETGSDKSSQASQEQLQRTRKSRHQQLARLVLEHKQTHLIRSRSASSQSPSLSTTASEDETHQSDDSAKGERGAVGRIRSRIPRPVTPIRGFSDQSWSTTLPQTQRSVSFIQYRTNSSVKTRIQKSASLHTNIHQQPPKPQLRPSKKLSHHPHSLGPSHSQGSWTATPTISRTSASTAPRSYTTSRTDSPSPQRIRRQYAANELQRQPQQPRPPGQSQSKSKPQDPIPKRNKLHSATAPQKGKKDPLESKTKIR